MGRNASSIKFITCTRAPGFDEPYDICANKHDGCLKLRKENLVLIFEWPTLYICAICAIYVLYVLFKLPFASLLCVCTILCVESINNDQ